jgi:hypothetical protein
MKVAYTVFRNRVLTFLMIALSIIMGMLWNGFLFIFMITVSYFLL